MAGQLLKRTAFTVIPGSPGMPADPGQAYRPGRIIRKTKTRTVLEPWDFIYAPAVMEWKMAAIAAMKTPPNLPDGVHQSSIVYFQWVTHTEHVVTYIPEQPYRPPHGPIPATPAQRVADFNLGWNSGARSIATYRGNLRYSFTMQPTSAGVITGISRTGADTGSGYGEIEFGLHFMGGSFRVVESGTAKTGFMPFALGDSFTIERKAYQVSYQQNGAVVYTSAQRVV